MGTLLRRAIRRLGFDVYRYPQACERLDAHLRMVFSRYRIDLLLDVGANVGQFGREARGAGYEGPIVSFEPIPEACEQIRKAAAGAGPWFVRPYALGSADGNLKLNVLSSSDFSSALQPSKVAADVFGDGVRVARVIDVPVHTLDAVLDDCLATSRSSGRAILLKMDTQGYDHAVLDGASRTLDRVIGVITEVAVRPLYEGCPHYLESLARLEGLGFEVTGLYPVTRDDRLRVLEFNCVMLRGPAGVGRRGSPDRTNQELA